TRHQNAFAVEIAVFACVRFMLHKHLLISWQAMHAAMCVFTKPYQTLAFHRYHPLALRQEQRYADVRVPEWSTSRPNLLAAGSAGLPQHHLRWVMQGAHDEESVRRRTRSGSRTTSETLERSDSLHASCAIGICLQDRQRFKFSE